MKLTPITPETLASSVIAVPPLARHDDLSLNEEQNVKLIRHIEAGGVTTLLYGGNANIYNIPISEYATLLKFLRRAVAPETLVIPAVGPAYGTMMDQAAILRDFDFPTAMVLPSSFAATPDGVATGLRSFADALGKPIVLYIKQEGAMTISAVAQMVAEGLISAIKYAVVRDNPARDDYLRDLVTAVDPRIIVSGIGEQPAIAHLQEFGLAGFTSGCVCIAPSLSMEMLAALRTGEADRAERIRQTFKPLEDLRNAISPIRVLHDAVTLSEIADMGPILPLLSNIEPDQRELVRATVLALMAVGTAEQ